MPNIFETVPKYFCSAAKWSSTEDIAHNAKDSGGGSFKDLPQTWTPRNQPSPSPDRRDFRPVNFDGSSLKRTKRSVSTEGSGSVPPAGPKPGDSFAWKDGDLDKELRAIKVRDSDIYSKNICSIVKNICYILKNICPTFKNIFRIRSSVTPPSPRMVVTEPAMVWSARCRTGPTPRYQR